jgi:histidinol-phosphate aminotransferase
MRTQPVHRSEIEEAVMSLSRRAFVQTLGIGAAGALTSSFIASRGREASLFGFEPLFAAEGDPIILASNENPLGPGTKALEAVRAAYGPQGALPGRYPFAIEDELIAALARKNGVKPENILLGCGSTQILRTSAQVFTSKTRPLVGSIPTYEECAGYAALIGSPVTGVPMTNDFRLDLDATLKASKGAGLVFYCSPNNPTATAMGGSDTKNFIAQLAKTSPETTVLVDEAYYDYVTDPSYETMIPVALVNPRVVVARTFSKAYGMAGLRVGYAIAHADTIKKMSDWESGGSLNILGLHAALATIDDSARLAAEKARNTEARQYTIDWFKKNGYTPTDSQTNFLFVDLKRPARGFRESCREMGVLVARDFPPYEKSHCRISIGTMAEMQRAIDVFSKVLSMPAKAAA